MGTGATTSSRIGVNNATGNPLRRPLGGQASGPGLFGLPGNGTFARRNPAASQGQSQAPTVARAKADDTPQKVGGLTFGQRRARIAALVVVPPVAVASSQRRAVLSMDELMAKYRRKPSKLPPAVVADDSEPVLPPTPAMLDAAHAADLREAFPAYYDEEADRCLPTLCGHADLALALHE